MIKRVTFIGLCAALALAMGRAKKDDAGGGEDKATADKATADKATADKATADKPTADKATADKPTADKATADKAAADTTASLAGKTQIALSFTATAEQVAEGDRLFKSHAAWMEKTHHKDGELALLRYNVAKGPELAKALDPSSKPTGNITFLLTEVYESPAGVADHWKQAQASWKEFGAFVKWASATKATALHGSSVAYSLWGNKPPAHTGKNQITLIFTATAEQVAEGDRLFKSHAAFMEKSHPRDGEFALLQYNVSKGPELEKALDPSSKATGNTTFLLFEVYESEAGIGNHWKLGSEGWKDFAAFVKWASSVKVTALHNGSVAYSLW